MLQRLSWSAAADGSQHKDSEHAQADLLGDTELASVGLRMLPSDNVQVLKEIEGVMEVLLRAVAESLEENPANPPFAKEGTDRYFLQGGDRSLR